jgi:hypothetical protein
MRKGQDAQARRFGVRLQKSTIATNPGTAELGQRRYGGVEVRERSNLKIRMFSGELGTEDPKVRGYLKDGRGGWKP